MRSAVERSLTFQSVETILLAPAYMNARLRPISSSPLAIRLIPVWQALKTTKLPGNSRLKIFLVVKTASPCVTDARISPESNGFSKSKKPWVAKCRIRDEGADSRTCDSVAARPVYSREPGSSELITLPSYSANGKLPTDCLNVGFAKIAAVRG